MVRYEVQRNENSDDGAGQGPDRLRQLVKAAATPAVADARSTGRTQEFLRCCPLAVLS